MSETHINDSGNKLLKRVLALIVSFGPGIFAIGYTIGTGSVTSMIVAGSEFGMQLLWVLMLSCLFSGLLIFVYGNFALITGDTALYSFKKNLKYGKLIAILIIIGITFGQWNSLMGILGISANIIFEMLNLRFPNLAAHRYSYVLAIAFVIISVMYALLLVGKYLFFEKILIIFVSIMGFSFLTSLFLVYPAPEEVLKGAIPSIPDVPGGELMVAAFVGTTMAAATFMSRPLFVRGKGWNQSNRSQQKKDAILAAIMVFVISGSIMAVASGALFHNGLKIKSVLDMANTLQPIAGKFATSLFFFGTLSAGLSSIFPCLLIAPLLIADYQSGVLDTSSKQFRLITAAACLVALIGPFLGYNPIMIQIVSQVLNVFVLPLVILGIIILVNNKKVMKDYRTSMLVNSGLVLAFLFACIISYNGILGLMDV